MVQPTTLVCKSRPGSLSIHGARPRNMLSESLLRNRISPIHKNSGSAVSVQAELAPQIVSIMLSPTGRLVNSSIPTSPTASRPRPIHMPAPSTAKSAMISTNAAIMSMLFSLGLLGDRPRAGNEPFAPAPARHDRIQKGQREGYAANRHAQLRNPQRRGIRGG